MVTQKTNKTHLTHTLSRSKSRSSAGQLRRCLISSSTVDGDGGSQYLACMNDLLTMYLDDFLPRSASHCSFFAASRAFFTSGSNCPTPVEKSMFALCSSSQCHPIVAYLTLLLVELVIGQVSVWHKEAVVVLVVDRLVVVILARVHNTLTLGLVLPLVVRVHLVVQQFLSTNKPNIRLYNEYVQMRLQMMKWTKEMPRLWRKARAASRMCSSCAMCHSTAVSWTPWDRSADTCTCSVFAVVVAVVAVVVLCL